MPLRQPIVAILAHVDHGKTTLADSIRGTRVAAREAGGITQHIGATEVPIEAIYRLCGPLLEGKKFTVPGLLFIDTPGHHSFVTLRSRSGALADLAVLVIDINEGIKPQTIESMNILRQHRTPFVIAANKIDLTPGWREVRQLTFAQAIAEQEASVAALVEERLYNLVGKLFERSFTADRYDRITDFTKTVTIVPTSAKFSIAIADLLLVLVGLAQRFLEVQLRTEEGPAEGTILEVKEEKGLGTTLDAIVYQGRLARGETIVVASRQAPIVTKVKALLKPKPLDEIRDPTQRFDSVSAVHAAAGIKVVAQGLEGALAGGLIRAAGKQVEEAVAALAEASQVKIELAEEGVILRADAIGSLEALAYEVRAASIPIRKAEIGSVTRKDVIEAAGFHNPLHRAILAFNTPINPDAEVELQSRETVLFEHDVIYRLVEDYQTWTARRTTELEADKRAAHVYPGKCRILPGHIFHVSKPAIVGVRILAGRIRPGDGLLREDGRTAGRVRSLRSGEEPLKEAMMGQEVAVAIDGVTVGRQIKPEDILLIDIPEAEARRLREERLRPDEQEALDQVAALKRKTEPFWGM